MRFKQKLNEAPVKIDIYFTEAGNNIGSSLADDYEGLVRYLSSVEYLNERSIQQGLCNFGIDDVQFSKVKIDRVSLKRRVVFVKIDHDYEMIIKF